MQTARNACFTFALLGYLGIPHDEGTFYLHTDASDNVETTI